MPAVLFAMSGVDYWTLADGSKHQCGLWPEEVAVPHRVFKEAGFEVIIATPGGVRPVIDEAGYAPEMTYNSIEKSNEFRAYIDGLAADFASPRALESVSANEIDCIFIPGGFSPMEDLSEFAPLGQLLSDLKNANKPVSAVCHGVAGILPAGTAPDSWEFDGYQVTGFSNAGDELLGFAPKAKWLLEDKLKEFGGIYSAADGDPFTPLVVEDRGLYTGQNSSSSEALARRVTEVLAVV